MITLDYKTLNLAMNSGSLARLCDHRFWKQTTRHRLRDLWKAAEKEIDKLKESELDLAKKYCKPGVEDDDGNTHFEFNSPAEKKAYLQESKELSEMQIELPGDLFYEGDDLTRPLGTKEAWPLSPIDEVNLEWLIKEGKKPEPEPEADPKAEAEDQPEGEEA